MSSPRDLFRAPPSSRARGLGRLLRNHYASDVDDTWLREAKERVRGRVLPSVTARANRSSRGSFTMPRWARALVLVAAAAVCASSASFALDSVVNLGKPTNAVPDGFFPLSGFRHAGKPLMLGHKVEMIVIGTQYQKDLKSAVERWPVVKALDQFGSFSDVRPLDRICPYARGTRIPVCSIASFDWTRARYTSRYVSFLHADLLRVDGRSFEPLSGTPLSLYDRYSRVPGSGVEDPLNARASVANVTTTHTLPLVVAGGYVQTISQALTLDGFQGITNVPQNPADPLSPGMATPTGLRFDTVHRMLFSGKAPKYNDLVFSVNAEANIMVGLICHADGMQPRGVCGRTAIKRIVGRLR